MIVCRYSVVSDCSRAHRLQPTRLLCPWDSPGKNTAVGCHFLLQGIFPTQRCNPRLFYLLHWQVGSFPLHHLGSACKVTLVQSLGCVQLFVIPWTTALKDSLSFTNSWSLLKVMCIESVVPSNHLILYCPFLLLPSIFPSIRVFSNESALCIGWSKYWSFSFSISPSNEYSGLISFRIYWFDLEVQGTLKSLLQHHSSKASVLWHSAFFMVQLSHPYMTTGKTIALTIQIFVCKVMTK